MERVRKEPEIQDNQEQNAEVIPTNPDEVKMRWKKVGGGSFYLNNKIIKPGQVFVASPKEIPVAFRDLVVSLGGYDFKAPQKAKAIAEVKGIKPEFTLKLRGNSTYLYDVLDAQGKVMNTKGLKKEIAEQFIIDLTKR